MLECLTPFFKDNILGRMIIQELLLGINKAKLTVYRKWPWIEFYTYVSGTEYDAISNALQDRATSIIIFFTSASITWLKYCWYSLKLHPINQSSCATSSLYQLDILRTQGLVTCKKKKPKNDCISGAIHVCLVKNWLYTFTSINT